MITATHSKELDSPVATSSRRTDRDAKVHQAKLGVALNQHIAHCYVGVKHIAL
jgi:hypothetical protein